MENVLLIRYAEIHLKGQNRPFFERKLMEGIKKALNGFNARIERQQGRVFVRGIFPEQQPEAIRRLDRVFGIHSISPALCVEKEWDRIAETAEQLMRGALDKGQGKTFKVFARRADKRFFMTSDEINRELGAFLLKRFPELKVDVHRPEIRFSVEIRDGAYLYTEEIRCRGGMPTGSAGHAVLLISGGIDSPVAGYMLAKRGVVLSAVHFFSYPYTSERARDKVIALVKILSSYAGAIRLYLVPFTQIQLAIHEKCPPKETTLLMRRLMMQISERLALAEGSRALITGEALGQVASQTLESLAVTDDAVQMPVFRPLIGFDKEDIIELAQRIGTFETSILPYEDCCTVFVPQHPLTRPEVGQLRESERLVDFTEMIRTAIDAAEILTIEE
ncbi:MAG: tRNA uracil 4-sulfurtransferase ThiI [Bacillota bacterium]